MSRRSVIFWNLGRLFGSGGSPIEHALRAGSKHAQATPLEVARKIQIIAGALDWVAALNGPPALIGFVEIENSGLAQQIASAMKSTSLVDIDSVSKDETGLALDGLNISLLLDPSTFDGPMRHRSHVIDRSFDTRDVLEVDLTLSQNRGQLSVLVNHWPSRLSGEGAGQRLAAAHYVHQLVEQKVRYTLAEMWDAPHGRMEVPRNKDLIARARRPVVVMFGVGPDGRPALGDVFSSRSASADGVEARERRRTGHRRFSPDTAFAAEPESPACNLNATTS